METFPRDVIGIKFFSDDVTEADFRRDDVTSGHDDVTSGHACCQRRAAVTCVNIMVLVVVAWARTPKSSYVISTLCRWLGAVVGLCLQVVHVAFMTSSRLMADHVVMLAGVLATWMVFPAAVDDLVFLVSVTGGQYWTLVTSGLRDVWGWVTTGEGAEQRR